MPNDANAPAGPFQFTLRTMFIVTTVVAIAMGGLCTPIAGVQALALLYLSLLVPALLTITLIYGRGYVRTFAIAALFPAGFALLCTMIYGLEDVFEADRFLAERQAAPAMVLVVASAMALIVLAGVTGMGMRWMIESPRPRPPASTETNVATNPSPPKGTPDA
ncbi:MAG: hypothetical protein LLG00_12370 [Planctomycetaceae bacterium]|nr:hypothetical protein [Planctomycetaceae bacterium]